jgi:hypothetical protein
MLALKETPVDRNHFRPENRGYHNIYHDNEVNHCPGCGGTSWHVGRISAECAGCGTAKPRVETRHSETSIFQRGPQGSRITIMRGHDRPKGWR